MKWTATQPATLPVTWAQLQSHLRLDDETQRDYVMEQLAAAAVDYAEGAMGRSLMTRTVTATFYARARDSLYLPRGPVTSVTGIVDAAGNTLPATSYSLEYVANAARLRVNGGLTSSVDLTVTYAAGYATAAAIPANLRHAIRMHVSHLWNNPDAYADKSLVAVPAGLEAFYRLHSWNTGVG